MTLAADIQKAADRLERCYDREDEAKADTKELLLELKVAALPVKAIKALVNAKRKDKIGKLRDETVDLVTTAPVLGIDLGIISESDGGKIANSGNSLKSHELTAALAAAAGIDGTIKAIHEARAYEETAA